MYGKHFESMYEGSMYGAGLAVFAVMGYVIAKQVPDRKVGSYVELNPKKLADTFGGSQEEIEKAIEFLCAPDEHSRSKEEGGRRLIRLGEFAFKVVNGAKYRAMRDEERRREQSREAKRRERLKKGGGSAREQLYVKTLEEKGGEAAEATLSEPEDEMEVE